MTPHTTKDVLTIDVGDILEFAGWSFRVETIVWRKANSIRISGTESRGACGRYSKTFLAGRTVRVRIDA